MRAPFLALFACGALANCTVDTDESIFIEGVLPPEEGKCSFKVAAQNPVFRAGGTYDIGGGAQSGYFAALQVRTNLPATFANTDVTQNKTQSPNYPSYGPVDNNVVIFETASIDYAFTTDKATGDALASAAAGINFGLTCVEGVCTLPTATAPATGTVFNTNTTLNGASIAATELLSLGTASSLKTVFETAQPSLLDGPNDRVRLVATVSIIGKTTGSGDIRKVTSFPLPFPIDLCIGCIAATEDVCDEFDAIPDPATGAVCLIGQDAEFQTCVCVERDNAGEPVSPIVVTRDVTDEKSCDEDN